ncbi:MULTISPECIES: helix-turn-helix domain-containing protein [Leeuwenhoekiella]|uniref:helix-turn-helix domain-containing protein n=1 Tax=Leeuwenhoekiella TaxID=283735 RepID=UPI002353A3F7|nr:helix-turn-helix domain-containing protein [Leeuwenhoekiella blandensis]|tara:strand:- start:2963 stop:4066 length:1104 start_codon:yes stop_codon:yes gene_type:complete
MSKLKDEIAFLSKPGDTILETIEFLGMSQVELAERLGKTAPKVNDLISGKEVISLNTALKLEKVLGIDSQFWIKREFIYREKLLKLKEQEDYEKYKKWLSIQPITVLKSLGYLKIETIGPEMVDECLKFYGVASPQQWESVYVNQFLSSNFRKSNAYDSSLGGISAFLRIGEIEMMRMKLNKFDKTVFKNSLNKIKKIVQSHPSNFAEELMEICAYSGVALVFTSKIPKAPISGVSRWVRGIPLIQLTDRYKWNDQFWFSFFHEAGHILLHGKKNIFIENSDIMDYTNIKETEANDFARKFLLPPKFLEDVPSNFSEKDLRKIAKIYNTHPAIVIGQLQHLGKAPYSFGNNLRLKVDLSKIIEKGKY